MPAIIAEMLGRGDKAVHLAAVQGINVHSHGSRLDIGIVDEKPSVAGSGMRVVIEFDGILDDGGDRRLQLSHIDFYAITRFQIKID